MKRNFENLNRWQHLRCGRYVLPAIFLLSFLSVAKAGVTIYVYETSEGVTATTVGSLNLSALERQGERYGNAPSLSPSKGAFSLGAASPTDVGLVDVGDPYKAVQGEQITRPSNFGSGAGTFASRGTGLFFGFYSFRDSFNDYDLITVPNDYVFGSAISSTAIFDDATLASLGLTIGQYVWSWGSGGTADSITMIVSQTLPPPNNAEKASNAAEKAKIAKSIAKLEKLLKKAKSKKQSAKAKKFQKKITKLTKTLRKLQAV